MGSPKVYLDVSLVQVELVVLAVINASGEGVSSVTRHVVREHEHDVRVRYPQAPHGVVHGEGVGDVAVVEPEARRAHLMVALK